MNTQKFLFSYQLRISNLKQCPPGSIYSLKLHYKTTAHVTPLLVTSFAVPHNNNKSMHLSQMNLFNSTKHNQQSQCWCQQIFNTSWDSVMDQNLEFI